MRDYKMKQAHSAMSGKPTEIEAPSVSDAVAAFRQAGHGNANTTQQQRVGRPRKAMHANTKTAATDMADAMQETVEQGAADAALDEDKLAAIVDAGVGAGIPQP